MKWVAGPIEPVYKLVGWRVRALVDLRHHRRDEIQRLQETAPYVDPNAVAPALEELLAGTEFEELLRRPTARDLDEGAEPKWDD